MFVRRVTLVVGLVVLLGLVWWWALVEPAQTPVQAAALPASKAHKPKPASAPEDAPSAADDSPEGKDASVDTEEVDAEVPDKDVTADELRATLALNGAFAAREVGRFCELADQLAKTPVFREHQGARDATSELYDLFGRREEERSLQLTDEVRRALMNGDGFELTEADFRNVDFSWMRKMRDYDRLTLADKREAASLWGEGTLPEPKFPLYFVRLRMLRAAQQGDWNDAVTDIRALADLFHSSGFTRGDTDAAALLQATVATADQLRSHGAQVPSLGLPSTETLRLHAAMAREVDRFVMPGVSPAVQLQAFDCARRAGLECTAVSSAVVMASRLNSVIDQDLPVSVDRTRCNHVKLQTPALDFLLPQYRFVEASLRRPSKLFGPLQNQTE